MARVRVLKCRGWGYRVFSLDEPGDDRVFWRPTWDMAWRKAQKLLRASDTDPWYVDLDSEERL